MYKPIMSDFVRSKLEKGLHRLLTEIGHVLVPVIEKGHVWNKEKAKMTTGLVLLEIYNMMNTTIRICDVGKMGRTKD